MSNSPLRKTQARVPERERARKQTERRDTLTQALPFVIGAFAVLFVGLVVFATLNSTTPANVNGTPRLQVDREHIDLGNRVFNQLVRAVFTIKNVGDGTLKLEAPRIATLLEGC